MRIMIAFCCAWLALTLSFGGHSWAAAPLDVGFSLPLTGALASGGRNNLAALEVWRNQVNAKGGISGRPLRLVYYDDQSNGDLAVNIYRQLIEVDRVDLIIAPFTPSSTNLLTTIIRQRGASSVGKLSITNSLATTLYVSPYSTDDAVNAEVSRILVNPTPPSSGPTPSERQCTWDLTKMQVHDYRGKLLGNWTGPPQAVPGSGVCLVTTATNVPSVSEYGSARIKVNCSAGGFMSSWDGNPIVAMVDPNSVQSSWFDGSKDVVKFLKYVEEKVAGVCRERPPTPTKYYIVGISPDGNLHGYQWGLFVATTYGIDSNGWSGNWRVTLNKYAEAATAQRVEQERRAVAERAQQAKEKIRKGFFAKSGTDRMVNIADILRNPFVFKGQVVNVWLQFSRMTAENEAEFNDPHPGVNLPAVITRNIPSSRFTNPENTIVAIRVIGLKDRYVEGEFVDAYTCLVAACQEFVKQGE